MPNTKSPNQKNSTMSKPADSLCHKRFVYEYWSNERNTQKIRGSFSLGNSSALYDLRGNISEGRKQG